MSSQSQRPLYWHPAEAAIAVMGAWMVGLVNVEGVYRQKATAKIAAALTITAMLLLANLVHGILWLSALTTFGVMFIAGLASLFANAIIGVMENLAEALLQQQRLRPLPDLDSYLDAIRDRVEQLHTQRASELASANGTVTATLQAMREGTPIFTQLDRIASEIASLHNAIERLRSHLR